jgi:type I restriction enzyme, S subunit
MNSPMLLSHFDQIGEAPNAIPRLKEFILELAARGKLIEQRPSDEPALDLLKRIQSAKGGFNSSSRADILAPNQVPFEIPNSWIWVRLGDICVKTGSGSTPRGGKAVYQREGVPFLRSQNIHNDGLRLDDVAYITIETHKKMSATALQASDLLLNITGGSIGRCCIVPSKFGAANVSQHVAIIRLAIDGLQRFVHQLILCPYFQSLIISEQTGAGRGGLPKNRMDRIPVALPPLAEQQRIVAKVDELMAVCDQLERANQKRQQVRAGLSAAASRTLTKGGWDKGFRNHANFYISHLSKLTVLPEQIPFMRQVVLDLAIQGKLAAQSCHDEPASKLLERIRSEKSKLIDDGTLKRDNSRPVLPNMPVPFSLPSGWAWSTLQSLCTSVTDGDHQPPPKTDHGIPFLVIGNVRNRVLNFTGCRYVSDQYYKSVDLIRRPKKNDILYTLVGSYGIPVLVVDDTPFCVQRHIGILRPSSLVNHRFLSWVLSSTLVFDQATKCATGIAQKTVPLAGLRMFLLPLPPVAEQERILVRINQLIGLCDQIELGLTNVRVQKTDLLDSVLHHALSHSEGGNDDAPLPPRDTPSEAVASTAKS